MDLYYSQEQKIERTSHNKSKFLSPRPSIFSSKSSFRAAIHHNFVPKAFISQYSIFPVQQKTETDADILVFIFKLSDLSAYNYSQPSPKRQAAHSTPLGSA